MGTYSAYQEAKIAHPEDDIKTDNLGNFFISVGHELCNPKDYCITVEKFLMDGYEFVKGDVVFEGRVKDLFTKSLVDIWNKTKPVDVSCAYILRAAAIENQKPIPKPETTEWKNGDTAYVEHCTHDEIKFIGLSGNNDIAVCECITEGRQVILDKFWVSELLKDKPESPKEKEKRERLEAAYDLYCHAQKFTGNKLPTFEIFINGEDVRLQAWLAIVDKTNYRKGE